MKPFLLWLQAVGIYLSPVADITIQAAPPMMKVFLAAYVVEWAVFLVQTWNEP